MAKYRRRKYGIKRRVGRWSPNIQRINTPQERALGGFFGDSITIAQNPVQSANSVSQNYTVKNIEVAAQIDSQSEAEVTSDIENIEYYILYVPEGYPIDLNIPFAHPEWIMAYKFIGNAISTSTSNSNSQVPKIRTRLSRTLKTGDSIIFMYMGNNKGNIAVDLRVNGLIRWWTKAN